MMKGRKKKHKNVSALSIKSIATTKNKKKTEKKKEKKKEKKRREEKKNNPKPITIAYVILGFRMTECNMTGLLLCGHAMLPRL